MTAGPITERLAEFLAASAGRAFALGSFDCGLFLADWCLDFTGRDPAAEIRGAYASVEQALILTKHTSTLRAFDAAFRSIGLRRTRAPAYGDIAMICVGEGEPRGAIVASGYVVPAEIVGLSVVPFTSARRLMAWSIHG